MTFVKFGYLILYYHNIGVHVNILIDVPGYICFRSDRNTGRGEVGIYIKDSSRVQKLSLIKMFI